MSNPRIHDRYELLDEMPHVTGGRLFRALDLAFDEIVSVKQLGEYCGLEPGPRGHLLNTIRHLQSLPHPLLARIYSFDAFGGLLVQEWVSGISLLDLLRRRRELAMHEAMRLLATLPATLDFLAREAVPIPRPLLSKLFIEFEDEGVADSVAAMPLDRWPPFQLKLHPLSLRGLIGDPVDQDSTATVVVDPRSPTDIQEGYGPRELALLLYELLGGRIREVDGRRYGPLSSLGEAGNAVLRRELLAMPHADCESLWRELLRSQESMSAPALPAMAAVTAPPARVFRIPDAYLQSAHPAEVASLESSDEETISIRLVARPKFTLGRSSGMADFVARVLPENGTNNARTNRLSRVHTLMEISEGQIALRDGNGGGPSLNGSFLDDQPLTPTRPTILPHRARLVLGMEFALDLIPLPLASAPPLQIENLADWTGPAEKKTSPPCRALVCEPVDGHVVSRHAVWLFSDVGFGLDDAGRIIWDTRGRGVSPAEFYYVHGCFWLSGTIFTVDDIPVNPGEIVPLLPGQTIRIGNQTFAVHME